MNLSNSHPLYSDQRRHLNNAASAMEGARKNAPACKTKFTAYLELHVQQYEQSGEFETKASTQLLAYLNKEGIFGTPALKKDALKMSARAFWDKHDGHAPELAAVMMHLTSKVTGSGEAERNWKEAKFVYYKARNRLTPVKREKLLTRYNVLSQRYGLLDPEEVDPAAEVAKYGDIRQDLEDPDADDAHNADDAVRENISKPYNEEGEETRIKTKEVDDDTARF